MRLDDPLGRQLNNKTQRDARSLRWHMKADTLTQTRRKISQSHHKFSSQPLFLWKERKKKNR